MMRGRFARVIVLRIPIRFLSGASRLAIKRLQRTAVPASKLACPSAADPQHDKIARIEVYPDLAYKLTHLELGLKVVQELKRLGFIYVTLDFEGYRTGSVNEVLPPINQEEIG
jgi:ATP-utilizing enzymes of the PP-loop superfamily